MHDLGTWATVVVTVSAAASACALREAGRAAVELVRNGRASTGSPLERRQTCRELLEKLD